MAPFARLTSLARSCCLCVDIALGVIPKNPRLHACARLNSKCELTHIKHRTNTAEAPHVEVQTKLLSAQTDPSVSNDIHQLSVIPKERGLSLMLPSSWTIATYSIIALQSSFVVNCFVPPHAPLSLHTTRLAASAIDETCEVLVLGSGPAGRAIASLLSAQQVDVVVADQNFDRSFPPNYGVWHDEWDTICRIYAAAGVPIRGGKEGSAIDRKWDQTDCYFGGSFDIPIEARMRLDREYYRVDKDALKESLSKGDYRVLYANHISTAIAPNLYEPAGSLVHDKDGTTIQLRKGNGQDLSVRTKMIVDCTGHESKLVLRDPRESSDGPGFQIAYGCLVDIEQDKTIENEIGPYDVNSMTLFDYRTDHFDDSDEETQKKVEKSPTFMYAMPLEANTIFFEETSLVARPGVSFQECKDRCMKRLEHHGIRITKLHEEEFCYIPMGGALPMKDQRILALGGAATMVHPSTGYHICRCLMGASELAKVITDGAEWKDLDRLSGKAYNTLWSPENQRQRNFAVFGGEFLMKQDVVGLRGFFDGFFRLPLPMWAGFLAGWPGLPYNDRHESWAARMWYGLNFIVRLPPAVAIDMFVNIAWYIAFQNLALAQSVTPFLGEPESFESTLNMDRLGDTAAKSEARTMILESRLNSDLPVDFEDKNAANGESERVVQKELVSDQTR